MSFASFGRIRWTDLDRATHPLTLTEHIERLLVEFAPDLEYGAVHLTFPGTDESEATTTSVRRRSPQLRSAYVPDAFGLQLLTGRHSVQAHDLPRWELTEVAEDRWILKAHDLGAWFHPTDPAAVKSRQFPDPALRARAREDFGPIVLTRETAGAHRPEC